MSFPSQSEDISYGRILASNNEVEWDYLSPTPGFLNNTLHISKAEWLENSFELNSVYPNPFNSNFKISLDVYDDLDEFRIDLISITGRTILSKTVLPYSSGTIIVPMNIDKTYASGTYFLRIIKNNTATSKKIILLK